MENPKPLGLNNEQLRAVIDLANKLVWKRPNLNVLRNDLAIEHSDFSKLLQDQFQSSHKRGKLILPDLAAFGNETISVFSDYAGDTSGNYYTYSFLTCAWNTSGQFTQHMKAVRASTGLGDKEIAFKDFRMGQMRRALPEYLRLLDHLLHGFLLTIVVDKRLVSLFGPNEKKTLSEIAEHLDSAGLGNWKPQVAEKLVRVVHSVAFLIGLLAESGQKIFWMTDNDAICSNEGVHKQALELLARAVAIYTDEGCNFPVFGGAAPFKERDLGHLDLLSLTDITASSIEHYLSRRDEMGPDDADVKLGSEQVLQWLAHDGISLSKMTIIIRPQEEGGMQVSNLEFGLEDPPKDVTYIPVVV